MLGVDVFVLEQVRFLINPTLFVASVAETVPPQIPDPVTD